MSCIMRNTKTIKSVDFTTDCPKRRNGTQCKYCYVEAARNNNYNGKEIINNIKYNGEVLKLQPKSIERFNNMGGIRMFSFGDYIQGEHYYDVEQFLLDCRKVGLKVKAITKQVQFVVDFHDRFEDVFTSIQLSVDSVGDGVNLITARAYRTLYSKVLIRAVILRISDFMDIEPYADILTLNHAYTANKIPNSINFSHHTNKELVQVITRKHSDKLCCQTKSCETCPIKCKSLPLRKD